MSETDECKLVDNGTTVEVIEAGDNPQSLWFRIGPVFDGDKERGEPGVWIEYQLIHRGSLPEGPVLLTPDVWLQLTRKVNRTLRKKRARMRWQRLKDPRRW